MDQVNKNNLKLTMNSLQHKNQDLYGLNQVQKYLINVFYLLYFQFL
jgi:hypothetical protein